MKNITTKYLVVILLLSILSSCSIGNIVDEKDFPVQLTEEDKKHPLVKYYHNVKAPTEDQYATLVLHEPEHGLLFEDINKMLEPGYLEMENGFTQFKDGTGYVAANIQFPKAKGEMLDWWFDWVGYEIMRYKIWYPGLHAITLFEGYDEPETYSISASVLDYPEGKTAHTIETLMKDGPLQDLAINFINPQKYNLDVSKLGQNQWAICADVKSGKHTIVQMVHFVREVDQGVELRSRFWIGNELPWIARKISIDEEQLYHLAHHCLTEYTQLSSFLPEVYNTYGNNNGNK